MDPLRIVVLEGDETGQELLEQSLRVLDPALLHFASERGAGPEPERASRAIYESVLECTAAGIRTPDLGGHASTSEFTTETIARIKTKLEAWDRLGSVG